MPSRAPSPTRARVGVSTLFFTNGVLFSAMLPRYPEIKAAFGLSDTAFGFLVVAFAVGALTAAGAAGPLVRRFGARLVAGGGSVLLAAVLALAASSRTVALFAVALLVAGLVDAIVDAAQNVQGILVEEWFGRSIINSLHAVWSLGATAGGLIGTWAAAQDVPVGTQVLVIGILFGAVAVVSAILSSTPLDGGVPEPQDAEADEGSTVGRPWRLLIPLVVLAICGALIEDVANSWATLFMMREAGAAAGIAGFGYTVVLASQFVGRLLGDPMTDRWDRDVVARAGGLVIAAGVLLAILGAGPAPALIGFGLMGFGCGTLVPAAYAAAGRLPGFPRGTGVAILGWLMRIGFLVTSPAIGAISDWAGLRIAFVVPLAAGLIAAGIAHRLALANRRTP
ncbi:MAG: MFS transporter [Tetrasphaera sp.]